MVRRLTFLLMILSLSGCVEGGPKPYSMPQNMAEFSTRGYEADEIPADVVIRAANITKRRGYGYFTLTAKGAAESWQPSVGFDYGRNPYGFGDAGFSQPTSLGAGISISPPRTNWVILMFSAKDKPTEQIYDANEVLAGK